MYECCAYLTFHRSLLREESVRQGEFMGREVILRKFSFNLMWKHMVSITCFVVYWHVFVSFTSAHLRQPDSMAGMLGDECDLLVKSGCSLLEAVHCAHK